MPQKPSKPLPVMPTVKDLWPTDYREFTWVGEDDKKGARAALDLVSKNASTALDSEFPVHGDRKDEAIIWSLSGRANQRIVLHGRWLRDKDSPFREWNADPKTRLVYFSFPADDFFKCDTFLIQTIGPLWAFICNNTHELFTFFLITSFNYLNQLNKPT